MHLKIVLFIFVCCVVTFNFVECKGGRGGRGGNFRGTGGHSTGGQRAGSSGGIFGWFKSLFGGSKPSSTSPSSAQGPSHHHNNHYDGSKRSEDTDYPWSKNSYNDDLHKNFKQPKLLPDGTIDFKDLENSMLNNNRKIGMETFEIANSIKNSKNPSSPGKIGFEGFNSGANHQTSFKNNEFITKNNLHPQKNFEIPINTGNFDYYKHHHAMNNFRQGNTIYHGNTGVHDLKSGINYHNNDLWNVKEQKIVYVPYRPWSYRYHYPRSYYYRNYNSGNQQTSSYYNPCYYYGGYNNNPMTEQNPALSFINPNQCSNGNMNIKSGGPGFGMGLLGGAATGISLGALLGLGLHSFGSTPWSINNDAFNQWLRLRIQNKLSENPSVFKSMNETSIINYVLNETNMCPGEANVLDASVLNTLVPCNATNIEFKETNVSAINHDECQFLTVTFVQFNSQQDRRQTLTVDIKQNNVTESKIFEELTYDIYFNLCIGTISPSNLTTCETKSFTANSYDILNETMSYFESVNMTITQHNITTNNSCSDFTKCINNSRNITSTYINWSILSNTPLNIMMSQCLILKNNLYQNGSSEFSDKSSKYTVQTINTDTFLTDGNFGNINILMHHSSELLNTPETVDDDSKDKNDEILTSTSVKPPVIVEGYSNHKNDEITKYVDNLVEHINQPSSSHNEKVDFEPFLENFRKIGLETFHLVKSIENQSSTNKREFEEYDSGANHKTLSENKNE